MQPDLAKVAPFLFAALLVFAVYRRLRRTFGPQPLRPVRMIVRLVLFVVIGCSLMPLALRSTEFLTAVLGALVFGVGLGVWGARRTRFLNRGDRLHYVPHTYTGIAVSLLFLGRLGYRIVQLYTGDHAAALAASPADPAQGFAPVSMVQSPSTIGLLYVLIGYYVCYYGMVLWKSKRITAEDMEIASGAASQ
jgi:hypothetical protein